MICNAVFSHIKYMDRYKDNHDDLTGLSGTANIKYPFKLYTENSEDSLTLPTCKLQEQRTYPNKREYRTIGA